MIRDKRDRRINFNSPNISSSLLILSSGTDANKSMKKRPPSTYRLAISL